MGRCTYVVFAGSLFLHLAVFWPEALPPVERAGMPLSVRLVPAPVAESDTLSSRSPDSESTQRRVVTSNDVEVDGVRRAPPQAASGSRQAEVRMRQARTGSDVQIGGQEGKLHHVESLAHYAHSVPDGADGDAVLVGRYRLALAGAAIRLLQLSGEALAGGPQGRSVVIVQLMPGGGFPDVQIEESSGDYVLDQRALALVRRAVLEVPAPPQGRQFSVVLPVLFEAI